MALLSPPKFTTMKKNSSPKAPIKKVLISVSVQGSPGPLRFLVNDEDPARQVIVASLKAYSKQGRIPFLDSDPDSFLLYSHDGLGCHVALGAQELAMRSSGARSFLMAKKPSENEEMISGCTTSSWKAWLHKPLSFKILMDVTLGKTLCAKY